MDDLYEAVGLWKNQTNPLTQIEVPSYRDTKQKKLVTDRAIAANINDAISALGLILRQDGMAWHQPFYDSKVSEANGMEFKLGRRTTPEETVRLGGVFGDGYAIVNIRDGFRVLKFDDSFQNIDFHKDAMARVNQVFGMDAEIEVDKFAFDGNLIENDWRSNPNGEVYRQRIEKSGRSDILRGLEDIVGPQIERLDSYWRSVAESGGQEQGIQSDTQQQGRSEGQPRRARSPSPIQLHARRGGADRGQHTSQPYQGGLSDVRAVQEPARAQHASSDFRHERRLPRLP
jgi:hypothetical protein